MKYTILASVLGLGLIAPLAAEEKKPSQAEKAKAIAEHQKGTDKLSDEQDNLSADVQELIDEQTNTNIIELLSSVEGLMVETIDKLDDRDTGGETIAIQTEIIEKIYEAAKEKSQ
ncbi:hypothetical protein N9291_00155 [bacterium]|nr:hypothetical protein [bacterium]MDB4508151.1 hypothetical protein [Akkermansiaceae bacterium]